MRAFGCGIAALLLLAAPGVPQEGGFQVPKGFYATAEYVMGDPKRQTPAVPEFSAGAGTTDVVVTDADGCVLECWRGDFRPGDVVRLGTERLALQDALPWEFLRLRPDRGLSKFYRDADLCHVWHRSDLKSRYWKWRHTPELAPPLPPLPDRLWPTAEDGAETELRFVLFLRKEAVAGLPTIWGPATAVDSYEFTMRSGRFRNESDGRSPRSDFSRCVVLIEGGRVVAPCPDEVAAATLAEFKTRAMLRTEPIPMGGYRFDPGVRRYSNFGQLSAVPALAGP